MQLAFAPHDNAAELARLAQLFGDQRRAFAAQPYPSEDLRLDRLQRLRKALLGQADRLVAAIAADFGHRSSHETRLMELFPALAGIGYCEEHLKGWMKPEKRGVSVWFKPASNSVLAQPLGVVGIIVPWNYPLMLAIGPLTAALAAGNRAVIKMSEFTPQTGETLRQVLAEAFDDSEVAVVNGGAEVAQAFAGYAWDHLLFTGSTSVGKLVMRAASDNLTPVTLELGGKSPTLVHHSYPINTAAERILHGKCLNAGQTCVAPDYVLLPEGKVEAFVAAASHAVASWYPDIGNNPDYTCIINGRHRDRLLSYLADAAGQGAKILPLAQCDPASGKIAPTLLLGVKDSMKVMQDEIFGPLLPVITYRSLDEAIAYINARPRPLALYYFDHDDKRVEQVLTQTHSGGVSVNETVLHVGQDDLPFGGIGPSGMGHYHGKEGFLTFSKIKPVFNQARVNTVFMMRPPYGAPLEKLLKLMLR